MIVLPRPIEHFDIFPKSMYNLSHQFRVSHLVFLALGILGFPVSKIRERMSDREEDLEYQRLVDTLSDEEYKLFNYIGINIEKKWREYDKFIHNSVYMPLRKISLLGSEQEYKRKIIDYIKANKELDERVFHGMMSVEMSLLRFISNNKHFTKKDIDDFTRNTFVYLMLRNCTSLKKTIKTLLSNILFECSDERAEYIIKELKTI